MGKAGKIGNFVSDTFVFVKHGQQLLVPFFTHPKRWCDTKGDK
jgi:hypothetical protein